MPPARWQWSSVAKSSPDQKYREPAPGMTKRNVARRTRRRNIQRDPVLRVSCSPWRNSRDAVFGFADVRSWLGRYGICLLATKNRIATELRGSKEKKDTQKGHQKLGMDEPKSITEPNYRGSSVS